MFRVVLYYWIVILKSKGDDQMKKNKTKYVNDFHKENYERFTIFVPKERIEVRFFLNNLRNHRNLMEWVCNKAKEEIESSIKKY